MNTIANWALLALLLPLFSLPGLAQLYDSTISRQAIFIDDFSAMANDWSVGSFNNGCHSASIANGVYTMRSFCEEDNPLYWTNMASIDQNRDFEIETEIQYVSGEENNALALVWGMEGNTLFRYRFGISGDGHYIIDKFAGGWFNSKNWTKSPLVVRDRFSKLTVRKVNYTCHYYINQELVHTAPFEPFFGSIVGFQCNKYTEMKVNYLQVSYLIRNNR